MTNEYLRAQEDAAFEIAFQSKFTERPSSMPRTFTPRIPKIPWYHDPESGGPNPIVKKPSIDYDETQPRGDYKF